ncbi:APSES transcription factor MbpA-like protein [Penicillium ucsense]|uniref:Cell pattern formation-associated protein stuA n=1 Tax=Penicillium ucsense TaxID=2839758 RepID=A0A8J8VZ96_9EURO|nr:APSES transcription factor MbpA-like protein [Penicillium ucsense]KAF7732630.1 APSES transcription factor MbpA-like protein [Penicillium ucsense]
MTSAKSGVGSANTLPYNKSHNSQSFSSTPRATPPPRGSEMSSFGISNGAASRGSFNANYDGANDYGSMMSYQEDQGPQIYRAVYSNISVYEMEVNGVAVMKRRSDSWLNATQILKVAGVAKARRTKTLEKEITAGEHEKVQGGYGKYQGTWVTYQRGVELCREYHVEELLRPLLEYDMSPDGSGPSHSALETPTKEQAMAAQRKRLYSGAENRGMTQSQQGTFFQNISRTAATAVNALSKARFDSPNANSRRPSVMRKPSQQLSSQESQMQISSQQSMYVSDSGFSSAPNRLPTHDENDELMEPPRKRMRSTSHQGPPIGLPRDHSTLSIHEPTPTEPNDSFYQDADLAPQSDDGHKRGIEAIAPASNPEGFKKQKLIMTLFLDKKMKDFSKHPAMLQLTSKELEMPLDNYQNNALHWAAMLARMPLIHALVAKGVNIFRVNAAGETALQKAVGTRNNLDYRSFPRLLQVLAPTIDMVDYSGRTILHHIAVMAATGGGGHVSAKHYLEALLEFIVRHGGSASANGNVGSETENSEVITLGRFISEIVNLRDDQGDTALNLAGRARSVLVPQLLEVGADPHIPNHTGLRPADYGVGVDMVDGNGQSKPEIERNDTFINQLAKSKKEIIDAAVSQISNVVQETLEGIARDLASASTQKQEKFDHWHSKIRESAKARQIEQKQLDALEKRASERAHLDRRIKNLEQSSKELMEDLKNTPGFDPTRTMEIGDADKATGVDFVMFKSLFPEDFDPSNGFSAQQLEFLKSLPRPEVLAQLIEGYRNINTGIMAEVNALKAKNAILGQNYRRMVMACTGWSAEKADESAEGLTQCVKELNDNPVPEDEAIEILMQDRGQDW